MTPRQPLPEPVIPLSVRWLELPQPGQPGLVEVIKGKTRAELYYVQEVDHQYSRCWRVRKVGKQEFRHVAIERRSGHWSCDCPFGGWVGDGRCKHVQSIALLLEITDPTPAGASADPNEPDYDPASDVERREADDLAEARAASDDPFWVD